MNIKLYGLQVTVYYIFYFPLAFVLAIFSKCYLAYRQYWSTRQASIIFLMTSAWFKYRTQLKYVAIKLGLGCILILIVTIDIFSIL